MVIPAQEMEYHIVSSMNLYELIGTVNDFCRDGWKPQGGPFEHSDLDGVIFISQAMIKKSLTT